MQKGKKFKGKVLAAMSGGVDSSVAALLLHQMGYEVVGVTMKLWGGPSDTGCCSVSDVEDARRAAHAIGIPHFVFNFGSEFRRGVVDPYIKSHQQAETPNPCIECNRHIKFDVLTERAEALGFDAVATGHYARIMRDENGELWLARSKDLEKDQSYVLSMLSSTDMERLMFPIGELLKSEVREIAANNNLRLARKPDSYEVCFIQKGGAQARASFLKHKIQPEAAEIIDMPENSKVGETPALQLFTLGQRKGLGLEGLDAPRYVLDIDRESKKVFVGKKADLLVHRQPIKNLDLRINPKNIDPNIRGAEYLKIQPSAHAEATPGNITDKTAINWDSPQKRIAPGQTLTFYIHDKELDCQKVVGSALAHK